MSAAFPLEDERTCRECQRSLPLASSFGRNGSSADGYETVCQDCVRERHTLVMAKKREASSRVATLRPVVDAWHVQKAMEREIDARATRIQAILAEARPLRPLEVALRVELRHLQAEQERAWEALRRLKAEWKLAVIAERRPEQLAQYDQVNRPPKGGR